MSIEFIYDATLMYTIYSRLPKKNKKTTVLSEKYDPSQSEAILWLANNLLKQGPQMYHSQKRLLRRASSIA